MRLSVIHVVADTTKYESRARWFPDAARRFARHYATADIAGRHKCRPLYVRVSPLITRPAVVGGSWPFAPWFLETVRSTAATLPLLTTRTVTGASSPHVQGRVTAFHSESSKGLDHSGAEFRRYRYL